MSPFPVAMRDRWKNRPEPSVGQGTVYWHALMSRYPEARAAAASAQEILRGFDGFHLTPPEWLHMTTLVAGSTERIPREQFAEIVATAQAALGIVCAPDVSLGKILYHPEAIMLAVEPADDLRAIRRAVDAATASVTGDPIDDDASSRWIPHVTVGYSTSGQPADPIIAALGTAITPHSVVVEAMTLVVQWGPERAWDWEPIGEVCLRRDNTPHVAAGG